MKIYEIISPIKIYLVWIKGRSKSVSISAATAKDAKQIAIHEFGSKNVLSITGFSTTQNEAFTQKRLQKPLEIMLPDERHSQYQRILSKKYLRALQFPPFSIEDKKRAFKSAITYLKRLKLTRDRQKYNIL